MASEMPQDIAAADSPVETAKQSVWRNEWQLVALAWLGGIMVGGIFLMFAFSLKSGAGENWTAVSAWFWALLGGGAFLILTPGSFATWEIWRGRRKSTSRGWLN